MDSRIQSNSSRLSIDECLAAQGAIDMEIEAIPPSSSPEFTRKLRAQRNAYAPINVWFPTELMVAILYDVVLDCRYSALLRAGFGGFNFYQNWIVISHVCQVWRTIAIDTPHLWEGISLINPDVTAVMLQRSGTSPILIDYNAWSDTEPPVSPLATALSHANRALEIDLFIPPIGLQNLLDEYLTRPMPFLRKLTIRISDEPADVTPCFLPLGCLEAACALDRLTLAAISFSPQCRLPMTLTELSLEGPPERFTVPQMIDILEPLENLRVLLIEHALRADAPGSTRPPVTRIPPRASLRKLCLSAPMRQESEFMNLFPITSATQTTLFCHPRALDDVGLGSLLHHAYGAPGLLHALCIIVPFSGKLSMQAYTTRMSHSQKCFELSVAPPPEESREFLLSELRDLCNKMPLDSVETLLVKYTSDDEKLGEDIAWLLASHLPGVRSLVAQEESLKYVLQVMHPQADGSGPGFPLLRELEVYDEYSSSEVLQQLLISLADCLVARKESGKTVDMEELEFAHQIIPPDNLQDPDKLRNWNIPPIKSH